MFLSAAACAVGTDRRERPDHRRRAVSPGRLRRRIGGVLGGPLFVQLDTGLVIHGVTVREELLEPLGLQHASLEFGLRLRLCAAPRLAAAVGLLRCSFRWSRPPIDTSLLSRPVAAGRQSRSYVLGLHDRSRICCSSGQPRRRPPAVDHRGGGSQRQALVTRNNGAEQQQQQQRRIRGDDACQLAAAVRRLAAVRWLSLGRRARIRTALVEPAASQLAQDG